MATITKRRRVRGAISWDAVVRVRGYPTRRKLFRTRLDAESRAARTEAAAHGRTLFLGRDLTLAELPDEAEPRLRRPVRTAIRYRPSTLVTFAHATSPPLSSLNTGIP